MKLNFGYRNLRRYGLPARESRIRLTIFLTKVIWQDEKNHAPSKTAKTNQLSLKSSQVSTFNKFLNFVLIKTHRKSIKSMLKLILNHLCNV
jgi:hypothetical protein